MEYYRCEDSQLHLILKCQRNWEINKMMNKTNNARVEWWALVTKGGLFALKKTNSLDSISMINTKERSKKNTCESGRRRDKE